MDSLICFINCFIYSSFAVFFNGDERITIRVFTFLKLSDDKRLNCLTIIYCNLIVHPIFMINKGRLSFSI
ncbi:hypothetical protein C1646_730766 [Rhizophagus diaphanus]|nr:hypothetical protein C1646_730766 [Rhizophagus diaphanus] [Rhizophagus sp. MUCL 43196]